MKLEFTKMHGIGNDYIYFNCMEKELDDPADVSVKMSPRHFSVGGDGIVMICSSDVADAKMRMFNADGSEGKMCGNAIRCVGKYLYDNDIVKKTEISIETLSGIKYLSLTVKDGAVSAVRVDMGNAILSAEKIPVKISDPPVRFPLEIDGRSYEMTCVSMGNPHAVTFLDEIDALPLEAIGPKFENHPIFPERVNTEFVKVLGKNHLKMRVWERGSGETWACGTGACAVAVASILCGYSEINEPIRIDLIGGSLEILCDENYRVFMSGSATKVYDGVYEYEN